MLEQQRCLSQDHLKGQTASFPAAALGSDLQQGTINHILTTKSFQLDLLNFYKTISNSPSLKHFAQSCPNLCDPMDCSLPGSFVYGIPQARVLEWVAISFSRGSSQSRDQSWVCHIAGRRFCHLSHAFWKAQIFNIYAHNYILSTESKAVKYNYSRCRRYTSWHKADLLLTEYDGEASTGQIFYPREEL